jgi:DNA-binding response OmpR family regulator
MQWRHALANIRHDRRMQVLIIEDEARIAAAVRQGCRRTGTMPPSSRQVVSRRVERAGVAVELTVQEFKLFHYVVQHADDVVA